MPTQIGLQYPQLQASAINPAALNPLLALGQGSGIQQQLGQQPYGFNPMQSFINPQHQQQQQQQLQLASLLAAQQLYQNPVLASILTNPLVAASLYAQAIGSHGAGQFGHQQPFNPQLGQIGQQFGSPFGQLGGQIGYPLAPQTWMGQGSPYGIPQGFGQGPLSQLGQRPFQAQSPWGY